MHAIEGSNNVPAFLTKLWRLVDDPNTNDLISWTHTGRSFLIQNQAIFSRELLPQYYKHNNMASFVRQLNMYGFHKVVSADSGGLKPERDEMEFAHPHFLRGQEDLLENIKRKQQRRIPGVDFSQIPASRTVVVEENQTVTKLLTDLKDMKQDQDSMSSKLMNLKRENEALWREYANMRQKFSKQQQIIEKLIHFLIAMVKSPTKPLVPKRKFGALALQGTDDPGAATSAKLGTLPHLSTATPIDLLESEGLGGGAQILEVTDLADLEGVEEELLSSSGGSEGSFFTTEEIPIIVRQGVPTGRQEKGGPANRKVIIKQESSMGSPTSQQQIPAGVRNIVTTTIQDIPFIVRQRTPITTQQIADITIKTSSAQDVPVLRRLKTHQNVSTPQRSPHIITSKDNISHRIDSSSMSSSGAGSFSGKVSVLEPGTILDMNGTPLILSSTSTTTTPTVTATIHPSSSASTEIIVPHSNIDTICATSVVSPEGTVMEVTSPSSFATLLDDPPLSPELLDTVDPSAVTSSFKYAASNVPVAASKGKGFNGKGGSMAVRSVGQKGKGKTITATAATNIITTNTTTSTTSTTNSTTTQKAAAPSTTQPQNSSMSVAVQDKSLDKHDFHHHMEDMQEAIDSLQDLFTTNNFNVDPSMLLTVFGSESNFLPDLDSVSSGNEVSLYHPSLLDLAEDIEEEDNPLTFLNTITSSSQNTSTSPLSAPSSSSPLSTPSSSSAVSYVVPSVRSPGPSPPKQLKLSIKKEKSEAVCDSLETPIISPVNPPPLYRGKRRTN